MKKIIYPLLITLLLSLSSCEEYCVLCHQIKLYEDAPAGTFSIISIQQACGYAEKKRYKSKDNQIQGADKEGNYKLWWECDLYPEDTTQTF